MESLVLRSTVRENSTTLRKNVTEVGVLVCDQTGSQAVDKVGYRVEQTEHFVVNLLGFLRKDWVEKDATVTKKFLPESRECAHRRRRSFLPTTSNEIESK